MTDHSVPSSVPSPPNARQPEPAHWRGIERLLADPEAQAALAEAFPRQASLLGDALDRRHFLKIMGASFGLAGLTACSAYPDDGKIVPYVKAPEEIVPGKPLFYASTFSMGGQVTGVLVESHMGRPTKIEGNPDHPASLGATDAFTQAAILTLYDPDRSQTTRYYGDARPYDMFLRDLRKMLDQHRADQGAGLRILTETVTSPTLGFQLQRILAAFPKAKWVQYEPCGRDQVRAGARLAFGRAVATQYRFEAADVVAAFDADFLAAGPGHVRYAQDFSRRRRARFGQDTTKQMSRLYMVECTLTSTGTVADHRIAVRPSELIEIANAVAVGLGIDTGRPAQPPAAHAKFVETLVKDLQAHAGKSLFLVGDYQPAALHFLAHAINARLGNVGKTLFYTDSPEIAPTDQEAEFRQLVTDMHAGAVETLIILEGNPAYTAAADVDFAGGLQKVKLAVHLSLYFDETSARCHWHIPASHFLECWGDARAHDGTVSVQQPLIAPLYRETKSPLELLAAFLDEFNQNSDEIVRHFWQRHLAQLKSGKAFTPNATGPVRVGRNAVGLQDDFEKQWRRTLHDGYLDGSAFTPIEVTLTGVASQVLATLPKPAGDGFEVVFRPDPMIYDGRFANNGWLQETPKPRTKLTWDNAVIVSPRTGAKLGVVRTHDTDPYAVVEVEVGGRRVRGAALIVPGHPDDTLTLHLGYGRERAGSVGNGAGFNANVLRAADHLWAASGAKVAKTGETARLACTQMHWEIEAAGAFERRQLVREATLTEYLSDPQFARTEFDDPKARKLTLFEPPDDYTKGYAWGMVVDMNVCTGCQACVVACTAENNIPIVGKAEVLREREMHWIRIDQYYAGDPNDPNLALHLQPVMCQHCEMAPCELVCPVAATTHSPEGINEMTYNRCVGTKYCANNCPYKVRRFNFLHYSDYDTPVLKLGRNPDVTVRTRGVMEKCTYCIQRINAARIEAEKEDRRILDGEVITACQAACPTQALIFGDINDPDSQIAQLRREPTNYGLLAELNVRPRTSYLAKVRNVHPDLTPSRKQATGHGGGHSGGHHSGNAAEPHGSGTPDKPTGSHAPGH
jgi:MoCo/4Fe-4S cofactor protein with predicted Tat translocation signal